MATLFEDEDEDDDNYGYQHGTCPRCHRTVWTDTGWFECSYCGYGADGPDEEVEDELHDDEESQ